MSNEKDHGGADAGALNNGLKSVVWQIKNWLDWDTKHRANENLATNDDTSIMTLPVPFWPSHRQFKAWIKLFEDCDAALSKPAPVAANASAEARLREAHIEVLRGLVDACAENVIGPDKTTGPHLINMIDVIERTPSMPIDKIARWTGFIQGVLCSCGIIDVDTERDRTRPIFSSHPHASDWDKQDK